MAQDDIINEIVRQGQAAGLNARAIQGVLGVVHWESQFDPYKMNKSSGAYGLFQDYRSRLSGLYSYAQKLGKDPGDYKTQISFAMNEMKHMPGFINRLNESPSAQHAAKMFNDEFERPGRDTNEHKKIISAVNFENKGVGSKPVEGATATAAEGRSEAAAPQPPKRDAWQSAPWHGNAPLPPERPETPVPPWPRPGGYPAHPQAPQAGPPPTPPARPGGHQISGEPTMPEYGGTGVTNDIYGGSPQSSGHLSNNPPGGNTNKPPWLNESPWGGQNISGKMSDIQQQGAAGVPVPNPPDASGKWQGIAPQGKQPLNVPMSDARRLSANFFSSGRAQKAGLQFNPNKPDLTPIKTSSGLTANVNKYAANAFQGLLGDLESQGYKITNIGGFNNREKRGGNTLSEHAFGNAIDINPQSNSFGGNKTDLPSNTSQLASKWGLSWGGDWQGKKDFMHFEWAGGPSMQMPEGTNQPSPNFPQQGGQARTFSGRQFNQPQQPPSPPSTSAPADSGGGGLGGIGKALGGIGKELGGGQKQGQKKPPPKIPDPPPFPPVPQFQHIDFSRRDPWMKKPYDDEQQQRDSA